MEQLKCKVCGEPFAPHPGNGVKYYCSRRCACKASADRWRAERPEDYAVYLREQKDKQLRRKYGISIEQYDELLLAQHGLCKICGRTCITGKSLSVDHDHKTGAVRGLLCVPCNQALGQFQESPEVMARAIVYILEAQRRADEVRKAGLSR